MLDALRGGIAEMFGEALEGLYDPAMLVTFTTVHAKNGDITRTAFGHECYVQEVNRSEAYRQAAGLADGQVEVIVLAMHLGEQEIVTDDELNTDTRNWSIVRAKLDSAKSQWKCVCKERKDG